MSLTHSRCPAWNTVSFWTLKSPRRLATGWMPNSRAISLPPALCRSYSETSVVGVDEMLREIYRSESWKSNALFDDARNRLWETNLLASDWDTYGADAPNKNARELASLILALLQAEALAPTRLLPSVEGGIAVSFVGKTVRAEIEIYNTGEIAAATYSGYEEPEVWEFNNIDDSIRSAIETIRERLRS